jgi:hypothetical protein
MAAQRLKAAAHAGGGCATKHVSQTKGDAPRVAGGSRYHTPLTGLVPPQTLHRR